MARVDERKDQRDAAPLELDATLDCPECGTMFEFVFVAPEGVFEREDLIDAPTAEVACMECGHEWVAEWDGWIAHEDAG